MDFDFDSLQNAAAGKALNDKPITAEHLRAAEALGARIVLGNSSQADVKRDLNDARMRLSADGLTLGAKMLWSLAVAAGAGRAVAQREAQGPRDAQAAAHRFSWTQLTLQSPGSWSAGFAAWSHAWKGEGAENLATLDKAPAFRHLSDNPIDQEALPEVFALKKKQGPLPVALAYAHWNAQRADILSQVGSSLAQAQEAWADAALDIAADKNSAFGAVLRDYPQWLGAHGAGLGG